MDNPFKEYKYTAQAWDYAQDVVNEKIVSCIYVKGACQRFLDDLERSKIAVNSFYFDPKKSERYLRLAQKFKHVKGEWGSPNIIYEPWQNFIFANIFGFISNITGSRRFRTGYCEVARGNGKSAIASQLGLYLLSLENPKGNEVYSAATGRDQARIILDSSRAMANANKSFLEGTGTKVLAHQIVHPASNSFFRALSSDSNTLDGLQPVCALIDELHAHKDRKVYDVIDSAMSKRSDSLLFMITTAGFSTTGIGYSQSSYAKRVALGEVEDDSFFSIVFTIDEDDDPFDSKVWLKANPNHGISVDPTNFAAKANKAKQNPTDTNNFIVKHLNVWTNAASPYFSTAKWVKLGDENLSIDDFLGEKCWIGIDLASKIDIASFSIVFKKDGKYYFFWKNYIPQATLLESKNNSYKKWEGDNHLISTQGEAINYPQLQDDLLEISKKFTINGVHYDPWNANEFSQRMAAKSIEMIEFRMNTGNLSEPMKRLEAIIREGNAVHDGNGLVSWSFGNVVAKVDANDNVFPRKENESLKIDPIVAAIMALAGWMQDEEKYSVYEERGIIVF